MSDIFQAIRDENIEKVTQFLEEGVDVNIQNTDGETPVNFACKYSKNVSKFIELFGKKGADVNIPDKNGQTPMFNAVARTDDY